MCLQVGSLRGVVYTCVGTAVVSRAQSTSTGAHGHPSKPLARALVGKQHNVPLKTALSSHNIGIAAVTTLMRVGS